jgi:hypothetical protein
MRILILLITSCAVAAGSGQANRAKPAPEPFSIAITAVRPEVEIGSPVELMIRLTNNSSHDIDTGAVYAQGGGGFNSSYQYDVRTEAGRPVRPRKPEGRIVGTAIMGTAKVGQTLEQKTVIDGVYELPPGKYSIQLARPVSLNPKDGLVKSNKITITVTPKGR